MFLFHDLPAVAGLLISRRFAVNRPSSTTSGNLRSMVNDDRAPCNGKLRHKNFETWSPEGPDTELYFQESGPTASVKLPERFESCSNRFPSSAGGGVDGDQEKAAKPH